MKKSQKPSRKSQLTRARLNRFAEDHSLNNTEVADLLGIPRSTAQFWLTNTKHKKYPRLKRCDEINAKLDELESPETAPVKPRLSWPVKPTTTEQELKWIVEGYRSEAIQGVTDELPYVLERYRKGVSE